MIRGDVVTPRETVSDVRELRQRLLEAEQTLAAIRACEVDSLVVEGPGGLRVYSLEGSSNSYRVLVEAMNEGAAALSSDGLVLYCNSRFARMLDVPLESFMGSTLLGHVPERYREEVQALLKATGDGESRGEVRLLTPAGSEIPVYLSINAIEDQGREVLCVVATDLRAQKRSEEIVRSERLAHSVLEQAAEAIAVCDERGRVIRASKAAVDLVGCNPVWCMFDDVCPICLEAGGEARHARLAAAALREEVVRAAPGVVRRKGGDDVHVVVSAAPLYGDQHRPIGCVITMTDVTESRRAADSLREADRRKDQFLAVLSHELRNPLAPIRNSLYVLQRSAPGAEGAGRALSIIDRQVAQLARLVDDLLDATRIASNKIELRREELDLDVLVRRTVDDHRSLFEQAGIAVAVSLPDAPIRISGDRARLAQVLGNLLQNAAKFTPPGGRVGVQVGRAGDGRAAIDVTDTGDGIRPEVLPRIFEPFAQADLTLDRRRGGLGLGLALARDLVELHGGEISASSDGPGRGARFTLALPVADHVNGAAAARPPPAATTPRRVLVIEDNIDAAGSLQAALALDGHRVEIAYNGPDGIAEARAFRPEVALCDIGLPGMDGYAVARAFKSDAELSGTLLVALSGYALPEDLEKARVAGFDRHLAKPVDIDELEAMLVALPAVRDARPG